MTSKPKNRLVILIISSSIMLVLFVFNLRRSSDEMLPPTPTQFISSEGLQTDVTVVAEAIIMTPPAPTPTPDLTATAEQENLEGTQAVEAQTATKQALIIATAQTGMSLATRNARAMSNIIKVIYEDGAVMSPEGSYKQVDDFEASYNRPGYYQMWFNDYRAKYFVLRANLLWDNAGQEISYPTAGCGIVFGYLDLSNHFRVFLNLDGNVRIHRMINGEFSIPSIDYYGPLQQPAGHANLIVAVDQGWLTVYINNQLMTRLYDEKINEGWLAYAVASGSATDFGTFCEFKDIELWIIE